MNSETTSPLKFPKLKYPLTDIQAKLEQYTMLDGFVFLPAYEQVTSSGSVIVLKAYAHGNTQGSTQMYNEVYYNWENPDTLTPYTDSELSVSGSVILSTNLISKADILTLITNDTDTVDVLSFTPFVNQYSQLCYQVWPAKYINGDYVTLPLPGGSGAINTNPSPPATIESMDPNN